MHVVVIRHGIALDRDIAATTGIEDAARPLTDQGRSRMQRAARGLAWLAPELTDVISSPWLRATQTAQLIATGYGPLRCSTSTALLPVAAPEALAALLTRYSPQKQLAVVGHEPHLSAWIAWALGGTADALDLRLRKGGVCLLRFPQLPQAGKAQLLWLLPPRVLRRLRAAHDTNHIER